jgi:REJ domain/IPT/TIG domain
VIAFCSADAATLRVHGEMTRKLLLRDSQADDTLSFSYQPEPGMYPSNYSVLVDSTVPEVLQRTDVDILPNIEGVNRVVNSSLTVDFQRSVGTTDLLISVFRGDGTKYVSVAIHYTLVGISFFTIDSGKQQLVPQNVYTTISYATLETLHPTTFEVLICFLDGSISSGSAGLQLVKNVLEQTKISSSDTSAILAAHSFDTCSTRQANSLTLGDDCSFGFLRNPDLVFALKFLPYRTGSVTIKFTCDALVAGSEFEESYETFLTIVVGGSPPPAVVSVQPVGSFSQNGGQIMKLAVINILKGTLCSLYLNKSVHLEQFGRQEYIESSKTTIVSFLTIPGKGKRVPYTVTAEIDNSSKPVVWGANGNPFSFDYSSGEELSISDMTPSLGPVVGGTVVTLSGTFPDFDASTQSGDQIYVGRSALPKASILSISETSITFKTPAKIPSSVQDYDVFIYVEVDGSQTNKVKFQYESFYALHIAVLGSSYDVDSGVHQIQLCPIEEERANPGRVLLIPEPNFGAHSDEIQYEWTLVDTETRTRILQSKEAWFKISKTMLLPGRDFEVYVLAKEASMGTIVQSRVDLHAKSGMFYGLALTTAKYRTISQPLTDVRITATLFDDSCCLRNSSGAFKELPTDVVFEWSYQGQQYQFSQGSKFILSASTGPRRFGREFIIPRESLQYGTHEVVCTASQKDSPSLSGTAAINFTVAPSAPRAQIGSGQSFLQVSPDSALAVTASESIDVDEYSIEPSSSSSANLQYSWRCEVSTSGGSRFNTVEKCPNNVLDKQNRNTKDLTIESMALKRLQTTGSSVFLRFYLIVTKVTPGDGTVASTEVSQTLEVSDKIVMSIARSAPQSVLFGTGSPGLPDLSSWRTDEPLIITPQGPADVEWRFKLVEPEPDSYSFLLNPRHLLPYPGYVQSSNMVAGRRALGIAQGSLSADTTYKFRIEFEASSGGGKSGGYEEVVVHTAQKPTVSFSAISETFGTTETIFKAKATPSFFSLDYKFYFFVDVPGEGRLCVDGCSGNDVVAFRLPHVGSYNISCAIIASRGNSDYEFAPETHLLTITEASHPTVLMLRGDSSLLGDDRLAQSDLNQTLRLGDHAAFGLKCIAIARSATNTSSSISNSQVSRHIEHALARMDGLATTTEPNTPLGRDYVRIALAFSALPIGSEAFGDPATFQDACRLVQTAVKNTPASEAYGLNSELVQFLSNMAKHAFQLQSAGSNRRRLLQTSDSESPSTLQLSVLDLAEMTVLTVSMALARNKPCGYQVTQVIPEVSNVTLAVLCNQEQGTRLLGEHSALHWCPEVYAKSGDSPRVFVLAEMMDYISSSNVLAYNEGPDATAARANSGANGSTLLARRKDGSDSEVLVKTFALKLSESLSPIATEILIAADADLSSDLFCFALNQTVKDTIHIFQPVSTADSTVSCASVDAIQFENIKELGKGLESEPYKEVSIGKSEKRFTSFEGGARQTSVLARLRNINGQTFGARRSDCSSSRPLLLGVSALAGLAVGLLIAVISSTLLL